MNGFTGKGINFEFKFENPKMVSIGSNKDIIIGTIIDEDFFSNANSFKTIEKGT